MPSDDQIDLVKQSVDCHFGLFAYFLLYTGCRRGEALALTYGDIDTDKKMIRINKSLYWQDNSPKIKSPKTEAGKRDVILLDKLAEIMPTGKRDALIFPDHEDGLFSGTRFRKQWKTYAEESGVTITPHQLRHAYATILFECGVSVKDAQDLLGHATAAMTQDIYTHLRNTRKQSTADLLNSKLNDTNTQ